MPWHGWDASTARVVGWAMQLSPPLRQTPSLGWPILVAGTTSSQPACGKRTETRGTYHTDGCSDTNACTWTRAHHSRSGNGTGSWPAGRPQPLPPTGGKPRACPAQHCVTAGRESIASGTRVPRGPGSHHGGEPSQAQQALTGTGGAQHPPTVQPQGPNALCVAEPAAPPPAGLLVGPSRAWKEPKRSPADQPEPGEAVVERISASHHVVAILNYTRRHFCCTVIHFTHQVQALPAGSGGRGEKSG